MPEDDVTLTRWLSRFNVNFPAVTLMGGDLPLAAGLERRTSARDFAMEFAARAAMEDVLFLIANL